MMHENPSQNNMVIENIFQEANVNTDQKVNKNTHSDVNDQNTPNMNDEILKKLKTL